MSELMKPAQPMGMPVSVPLPPAQPQTVNLTLKPEMMRKAMLKIGPEQLRKANLTLIKYKNGKAMLEKRLIINEKWWESRGWTEMQEQGNPTQAKRPTQWLFNVVMGKHADMIEAYPEPVILPREQGDKEEAKRLTSIVPVVLEQNDFAEVYDLQAWELNKSGTAVYGVFWDSSKQGGLGDISIVPIDLLNLFWEPGVTDIQKSTNLFHISLENKESLVRRYPQLDGQQLDGPFTLAEYQQEEHIDQTDKALVIDWYYHTYQGGQKILHYCKYVGEHVLYASEDDEALQGKGWYDDGEYPFVVDNLFPVKRTICGRGYIDMGKYAQEGIDLLDQAVTLNAMHNAVPRYLVGNDSKINEAEFADFKRPFIHVEGNVNEDNVVPLQTRALNGMAVTFLNNKIEELKQTTGNQDVANGSAGGVTAASSIAALQAAAGRSSKDAIRATYRAYSRIVKKVIERIRQFYDIPRQFRILGDQAQMEFVAYDNHGIAPMMQYGPGGEQVGYRIPEFDIEVAAQKRNEYSKMAANELALQLLNAGVFNPQMADQSLLLLDMMDFDRKDERVQKVQMMQTLQNQLIMWQQMALKLASQADPALAEEMAMNLGGGQMMPQSPGSVDPGAIKRAASDGTGENKIVEKARERAENASQPT